MESKQNLNAFCVPITKPNLSRVCATNKLQFPGSLWDFFVFLWFCIVLWRLQMLSGRGEYPNTAPLCASNAWVVIVLLKHNEHGTGLKKQWKWWIGGLANKLWLKAGLLFRTTNGISPTVSTTLTWAGLSQIWQLLLRSLFSFDSISVTSTVTKSSLAQRSVYLSYTSRSQSTTEGFQGRNSSKNLEAETMEEAAYWLTHTLMFSWLSNTA